MVMEICQLEATDGYTPTDATRVYFISLVHQSRSNFVLNHNCWLNTNNRSIRVGSPTHQSMDLRLGRCRRGMDNTRPVVIPLAVSRNHIAILLNEIN